MDVKRRTKFPHNWLEEDEDHHNAAVLIHDSSPMSKEIVSFDGISPSAIVPLTALKHWPRPIVCPACHEASITRVERKICGGTHTYAALLLLCTAVGGPVPYFSKAFKNTVHYCCRCNKRLATFHFQSGVELHVF